MRRPQQRRSERSLEAMLQATETLIIRSGIDSLTIADVLHESGVANGTFYARFGGKDALLQAVQDRVLARVEASMAAECATLADPLVPLEAAVAGIAHALSRQFHSQAGLLRGLMQQGSTDPILRARAGATRAKVDALFAALVTPRLTQPQHERQRRVAVAQGVLSSALVAQVSADESVPLANRLPWDVLIPELVRMLLGYLLAPSSPAPPSPS